MDALFGKGVRIMQNICWEPPTCIYVENKLKTYTKIEGCERLGNVFSPHLFKLYSETILRKLKALPRFIIGGHNLNNKRYAEDTVLMMDTEVIVQYLLN